MADDEDLIRAAIARLDAAGARDEVLVDFSRPRWAGWKLAPKMVRVDRVWRLGVLLLGRSGALYAAGLTLHVTQPRHPNAQSVLAEERRELRRIAVKSGIPAGETVDFDARDIRLDELTPQTRPVARTEDGLMVKWSTASDQLSPFAAYLDERVELLVNPPSGA